MEIVRIAGIDPASRFTGYGIVNLDMEKEEIWVSNCGVAKSNPKFKKTDAILDMMDKLRVVFERECFNVCENVVVEIPAAIFSPNFPSSSFLPVAVAAGICLALVDREKVVPVYPAVWNATRGKEKTKLLVEKDLGAHDTWLYDDVIKAKSQFEHVIDAAGMAWWYMKMKYMEE